MTKKNDKSWIDTKGQMSNENQLNYNIQKSLLIKLQNFDYGFHPSPWWIKITLQHFLKYKLKHKKYMHYASKHLWSPLKVIQKRTNILTF